MNVVSETRAAMRKVARDRTLVDLRDGRRQRSNRIESAKRYKRNQKHRSYE